jgi:hypothetical protein
MTNRLLELAGIVQERVDLELDEYNLKVTLARYAHDWALGKTNGDHLAARELLVGAAMGDILPEDIMRDAHDLALKMCDYNSGRRDQKIEKDDPAQELPRPKKTYRVR